MLLPYLTDELGIAALWAGVIVFLPKAWDVVLNPVAGRDQRPHRRPGRAASALAAPGGLMLAGAFALIFAAPDLGSQWLEAEWVLVFFAWPRRRTRSSRCPTSRCRRRSPRRTTSAPG